MTVSYLGGATPIKEIDQLVKSVISNGYKIIGSNTRFTAGTELSKGYAWYTAANGSTQVVINQDTVQADPRYRTLGDKSKREQVQVYIDVFGPANKIRLVTREIDRLIWEASQTKPIIQQIVEFRDTECYWIMQQKQDIKDNIAPLFRNCYHCII